MLFGLFVTRIFVYCLVFQQRAQRLPSPTPSSDSDSGYFVPAIDFLFATVGFEIGSPSTHDRSPSPQPSDSMPGPGIAGVRARFGTACRIASSSTPVDASPADPGEMVPLSVYTELRDECDHQLATITMLQSHLDTLAADSRLSSSSVARLRSLIQTATDQTEQLPPPTNVKYGQGRLLCQMMIDELQSIVDQE